LIHDLWRGERREVRFLRGEEVSAVIRLVRALRRRTVRKSEGAILATNEWDWSECGRTCFFLSRSLAKTSERDANFKKRRDSYILSCSHDTLLIITRLRLRSQFFSPISACCSSTKQQGYNISFSSSQMTSCAPPIVPAACGTRVSAAVGDVSPDTSLHEECETVAGAMPRMPREYTKRLRTKTPVIKNDSFAKVGVQKQAVVKIARLWGILVRLDNRSTLQVQAAAIKLVVKLSLLARLFRYWRAETMNKTWNGRPWSRSVFVS
jgi:hypothetical protein